MKSNLYYNTLLMVTTDGRKVWNDKEFSNGFVPKGRAAIYYKIGGKVISRKKVLNCRYLVKINEQKLPF